jgi:hypothetical protein
MGRSFSDADERRRALMEAIFREHFSAVHRYISNKVRQTEVADDLTSMVFLKAFRWLGEDRGVRQVRSWLYAAARSTIADYWQEHLMHESTNKPVTVYTEQGQRALDLAKEEALSFHHHYIGTEHLLLGILSEGSAAASLTAQGATLARVRAELLCVVGKNEPDPRAGTPLTPRSQRILEMAGEIAEKRGETTISPEHILQALVYEKHGIAVHMLRPIGVNLDYWQATEEQPSPEKNEQHIRKLEHWVAQHPQLDEEEERQLAHLVARGRAEQRRAELIKETPDPHLVEEGNAAYFRLIPASQHLVLSVAKEYFGPERDAEEIINAGNSGLSLAAVTFGTKKQTPFRAYAIHTIHLQIMETLE